MGTRTETRGFRVQTQKVSNGHIKKALGVEPSHKKKGSRQRLFAIANAYAEKTITKANEARIPLKTKKKRKKKTLDIEDTTAKKDTEGDAEMHPEDVPNNKAGEKSKGKERVQKTESDMQGVRTTKAADTKIASSSSRTSDSKPPKTEKKKRSGFKLKTLELNMQRIRIVVEAEKEVEKHVAGLGHKDTRMEEDVESLKINVTYVRSDI